ncbi:Conserved_hypothetical protein [Hexamita inflata]|uniref:Ubiquitin-like domain-containing protein n=2 Tax=Hexamita inflata TaxID=28002 RepID=A0AA86UH87_9EUKA|nr:Conserved hypothetical protein [Hexamita inflata]CAI9951057.1 Conserved hypothetical protein [Hexamita inflata]CAI9967409.1 Conserved hypothetical protein [Hexamita inflata]
MLIKLCMKTLDVNYIIEFPGDTKISKIREEASKRFKIPEAGIKLTANGQDLQLTESLCLSVKENETIYVDLDEDNFESNETQMKKERLLEKLQQSNDVHKLLAFYQQNEKIIEPFILTAQDKLKKSLKIIKFVEELKKAETVDLETIDKKQIEEQVNKGELEHNQDLQEIFPQTYLSYYLQDHYFQNQVNIEIAKRELGDKVPLALQGEQPYKAQALKGPESDFYELDQLEKQNITTVLVENLFTELAVMVIILEEALKKKEGQNFENYHQKDHFEDLKRINMITIYNLMELIDIKDLLLGQYVARKSKLDQGNIKLGYQAYINGLRRAYANELEIVKMLGVTAPDSDILQRLEANGGDAQKTAMDFQK